MVAKQGHSHRIVLLRTLEFKGCCVQKADGCWWFGEPGHCGTWNVLIVTLFTCAVLDFILVSCILIFGTAADNAAQSKRMERCAPSQMDPCTAFHAPGACIFLCSSHIFSTEEETVKVYARYTTSYYDRTRPQTLSLVNLSLIHI